MFGTYKVAFFRKRTLPPDASQYLSKRPLGMPEKQQNHSEKWFGGPGISDFQLLFGPYSRNPRPGQHGSSNIMSAGVRMPFCKAGNAGVSELCDALKL